MHTMRKIALAVLAVVLVWGLPAVAAPVPLPKISGGDADRWLLDDAEAILVLNAKQMMASDLMKKGGAAGVKDLVKSVEQIKDVVEATGLDVTKDIDSLVGSAVTGKAPKTLVVVKGSFDVDKVSGALKKKAEKVLTEGNYTVYQVKLQDTPMFGIVADKNTIVLAHSKELAADRAKNGGKKAAKLSKDMKTALSKFTGKESLVLIILVTEDLKKQFAKLPAEVSNQINKLQTLTASLTISDSLALHISGVTGDAKSARQIAARLDLLKATAAALIATQEDLPAGVNEILKAIKIDSTKESADITLKLTKEQIEKLGKSDN